MKSFLTFIFTVVLSVSLFAQDYAVQQLENSPRHHEWVTLESSDRTMHNFVAYPEQSENATVVIVIHEIADLITGHAALPISWPKPDI